MLHLLSKPRTPTPPAPPQTTTHLHITIPSHIPLLPRYKSLTHISLANFKQPLTATLLAPLSNFHLLFLLDVSYTSTTLQVLQRVLRGVHVLRLRTFGSGVWDVKGVTEAQTRGFLEWVLPDVWEVDGVVVLERERAKWEQYFTEGGGKHSVLVRKHLLVGGEGGFNGSVKGKIVTRQAEELVRAMPNAFLMGMDRDVWRLRTLAHVLEQNVLRSLPPSHASILGGKIQFLFTTSLSTTTTPETSTPSKLILALLLFASLSPAFDGLHKVLQEVLESIFITRRDGMAEMEGRVYHWCQKGLSFLSWDVHERCEMLSLCWSGVWLDTMSERSQTAAPGLVSDEMLVDVREVIAGMSEVASGFASLKPSTSKSRTTITTSTLPILSLTPKTPHTKTIAKLTLETTLLATLLPSTSFLAAFLAMRQIAEEAIGCLDPGWIGKIQGVGNYGDQWGKEDTEEVADLDVDVRATEMKFELGRVVEECVRRAAQVDVVDG
ncbi:hypothetical protein HDV00_002423 [Rhizophlyctis rosea]|nr:hypothetical protein HDV00_002423 [Rhizophlyctis rosea]